MKPFPSIGQFRQIIREVKSHHDYAGKSINNGDPIYLHTTPYPTIKFTGTVKLHGTNAGVVRYSDGRTEYQSRENVLALGKDNSGFMLAMSNKLLAFLFDGIEFTDHVAVFGEWCGQGIQSGVAISQLPKMFVIFATQVDSKWVQTRNNVDGYSDEYANEKGIFFVEQFGTFELEIDFNNPEIAQNDLVSITEAIEKQCPAGKFFGIDGVGEGVVWKAQYNDHFYQFKVKGEKHSVSKVKTLAPVDIEQVENVKAFVENVVTANRLEQGFQYLERNSSAPPDQTNTGDFLRWVVNDVIKEEQDTIVKNQLDVKKINSAISAKARVWYFNHLNSLAF